MPLSRRPSRGAEIVLDDVVPCEVEGRASSTAFERASSKTCCGASETGLRGAGTTPFLSSSTCPSKPSAWSAFLANSVSNLGMLFFDLKAGMLLRTSVMARFTPLLLLSCCCSKRSISPNKVLPLHAKFSSGIGTNLTMPRSAGTLSMSAMKDWMSAALRLLVVACICEGTTERVRI